MSNEAERQFQNFIAPKQSTTPGVGVTWLATSTAAAVYDLNAYPDMFGKYMTFVASGAKIWISTSDDGATAISKATSPGTTIAAGTVKAAPIPIGDGVAVSMRLDRTRNRYLHVQADSGTPTLIIFPTAQPRLGDVSPRTP